MVSTLSDPFYWGVSASSFQSEGSWNADAKGNSIWDIFVKNKLRINSDSAEFYKLFQNDLDLMASMGIRNFRWSVSWPRIFPEGFGRINQAGLDFYDRLTDACLQREITPWVTLYHWDLPAELEKKGGWINRDILNWYCSYTETVVRKLGDRVKNWMALNEPMVFTGAGYFMGVHAPGKKGAANFLPAMHHAALAQAEGIRIIRNNCSRAFAGTTFSTTLFTPASLLFKDIDATKRADALLNRVFIETLLGYGYPVKDLPFLNKLDKWIKSEDENLLMEIPDFAGIQVYTREVIRYSWFTPYLKAQLVDARSRRAEATMMNWEIYPGSISSMIRKFNDYPELPKIIVTENGAAFHDEVIFQEVNDHKRVAYLQNHIKEVLKTIKEGCRVKGYFVWSFTDNLEWAEGYQPRFGLVHVDYSSQKRIIKSSGHWYSHFILEREKHLAALPGT